MGYWLKGCRRCGGDLYRGWDPYDGYYASCLQCGHRPARDAGGTGHEVIQAAASLARDTPAVPHRQPRPP